MVSPDFPGTQHHPRCRASDLDKFKNTDSVWDLPSQSHTLIQKAIESVLPVEFKVHEISARSFLVDRNEFEKTELERLIEAQKDLMIAVATGGPRIESKNREYKERSVGENGDKSNNCSIYVTPSTLC